MRKIRTATVTFHASHNYGSMLQAYALQRSLERLGFDNEIVNLRTERQRRQYRACLDFPAWGLKPWARRLCVLPFRRQLLKKYELFEAFLREELKLTREFRSLDEVEAADLAYDCCISGGDQLWNTSNLDFDWSFFLPFAGKARRISYSVSMGPHASETLRDRERVAACLSRYDRISVREEGTAEEVRRLVDREVSVEADPALLLDGKEWEERLEPEPLVEGDYILLYAPWYRKPVYDTARRLSRKLKMKVVVTLFSYQDYLYPFERKYAAGPWEFLNLVRHARLVVSGSFHALVFATLFHTPFLAVDGDKDNRMKAFLHDMGLEDRTVTPGAEEAKVAGALSCSFAAADRSIAGCRTKGLDYLKHAIGGGL